MVSHGSIMGRRGRHYSTLKTLIHTVNGKNRFSQSFFIFQFYYKIIKTKFIQYFINIESN
jgi:hypothetical protein